MRDPEMILRLLREMADDPSGQKFTVAYKGMDEDEQAERHHVELLVDAGHARWLSHQMARITNDGYDFLNAVENVEGTRTRFIEMFEKGVPYAKAVLEIVQVAKAAVAF